MVKKTKENAKKWIFLCNFLLFSVFFSVANAKTVTTSKKISPVGLWQTTDRNTGKPRSIVKIWIEKDELRGRLSKVNYNKGEGPNDVCVNCQGKSHNHRLLGLTILWGMHGDGYHWSGGRIIDPESGKVYSVNANSSPDGKKLHLRGDIRRPMFGRTAVWRRINTPLKADLSQPFT